MACAAASARQYGMDIRGKILSWKLYRESLLSRPYGHTVWGNVRPDGSQKPLSATSTPSFGHLMPYRASYGISNTTCLGACLRACNTRLLVCHHKKRKKSTKKNIEKIVLDCYSAGFCLFTAPLRISGAWISGFTTVSSLVNCSRLLLYEVTGLYHSPSSVLITVRDGARHPRGIYLLLSCAAEF